MKKKTPWYQSLPWSRRLEAEDKVASVEAKIEQNEKDTPLISVSTKQLSTLQKLLTLLRAYKYVKAVSKEMSKPKD